MLRVQILPLWVLLPILFSGVCWLPAQHDPARDAVRLLAKGAVEDALTRAAKEAGWMNSPIDEAEKSFFRLIVACHQGNPDDAFKLAKQAVIQGLPVTRLQASPGDVLKPLHEHEPYRKWVAARSTPLIHGPMLGAVTDRSASFWVRTATECDVQIRLRAVDVDSGDAAVILGKGRTSAEHDFTAVITTEEKLMPDHTYRYQLEIDGAPVGKAQEFRTFPEAGEGTKFSIAFGGCAGYTPEYERMWTTIAGHDPLALLMLGDNVYIDDPEHPLTHDFCYYRRHSQPNWRELVASTPVSAIYDDHDFGLNDCSGGPGIEVPAWKRPVWETFRNNWNNHAYAGGQEQPGVWHDFYIGDVHFILLDGRYYRDPEGGTMLGQVQKAWLKQTLKNSKGTFKMIASPVPWSPGVKPGSKDTWDGYAAEREEIFSFIEENRIEGVVLMAADRHRVDYRRIPWPSGYDFYEMMSARLTNVHTHELVSEAKGSEFLMGHNETPAFGLVEFDTTADEPSLTYRILTIDNQEVGKSKLPLSALKFK